LTLLLGPNGVGKTAVLNVIHALRKLLSGEVKITGNKDEEIFHTSTLTRWQLVDTQVFELDVMLDDLAFRYRLEIGHERSGRQATVRLERLDCQGKPLFSFKRGEVQLYTDDHTAGPRFPSKYDESPLARVAAGPSNTKLTKFLDYARGIVICGLQPAHFATESVSEDRMLDRNAGNFPAWYRHGLLERPEFLPGLSRSLMEVIDGFESLRMEKVGVDAHALKVVFVRDLKRYELRFDELSDGQRALIVLYSLLHIAPGQRYTLLLDEPDNYVALPEIQPWLIELADSCGAAIPQAVLCSHHPELIDYLGGDRGVLLKRESSGVTKVSSARQLVVDGGLKLSELIARGWER